MTERRWQWGLGLLAVVWLAGTAEAGNYQVARFAKFAIDRCVMPVLMGAPPDSAGLLRQREKTDHMTPEQLETYNSRQVFSSLGMRLWMPDAGGCSAGAIGLEPDDMLPVLETWRATNRQLSLVRVEEDDGVTTQQHAWAVDDRTVEMTVRIAAPIPGKRPAFASITMKEKE